MRLNIVFVLLLFVAATAVSVAWRATEAALDGDAIGWLSVVVAASVGLASLLLLGRIVGRVTKARRGEGARHA